MPINKFAGGIKIMYNEANIKKIPINRRYKNPRQLAANECTDTKHNRENRSHDY